VTGAEQDAEPTPEELAAITAAAGELADKDQRVGLLDRALVLTLQRLAPSDALDILAWCTAGVLRRHVHNRRARGQALASLSQRTATALEVQDEAEKDARRQLGMGSA